MPKFKDITGQKFGKLTVVCFAGVLSGNSRWKCACECGGSTISHIGSLRRGEAKSCGCLRSEKSKLQFTSHGMSHTKIHRIWRAMIERCYNAHCKGYPNYGGRGITVSDEWLEFSNFYADMGDRPSPKHSIERNDVDGNYCKDNCRWATMVEQQNNRRDNVWITYKGETKTLSQWSKLFNINRQTIADRIKTGRSLEESFSQKSLKIGRPINSLK